MIIIRSANLSIRLAKIKILIQKSKQKSRHLPHFGSISCRNRVLNRLDLSIKTPKNEVEQIWVFKLAEFIYLLNHYYKIEAY